MCTEGFSQRRMLLLYCQRNSAKEKTTAVLVTKLLNLIAWSFEQSKAMNIFDELLIMEK